MQPSLATYGGLLHDAGYDGQIVDENFAEIINMMNDQATAIQFGNAVARSLADALSQTGSVYPLATCKAPAADTDKLIGLAVRWAIRPAPGFGQTSAGVVSFAQNDMVPILRKGMMFKTPVENVSKGDAVMSLTAQNGALGSAANNLLPTAVAAAQGGTAASGTITLTTNPAAGDTVTVNGFAISFVASGAVAANGQVNIGAANTNTATNLQAFLDQNDSPLLTVAKYTVATNVVTVTYLTPGTGGNAFTLAKTGTNIAVSAATLASGAGNTGNATIALAGQPTTINAKPGTYQIICTAATTANVLDPLGSLVGTCTFATAFANEVLFTITAGGTPCIAGDTFTVVVSAAAGRAPVPNCLWETTTVAGSMGIVRIDN